jgi:ABC-type branched-subunit amino acid transport system substrate-binding protein
MVIGVPTLLSGDWAELGGNIEKTIRTYQKHYLRHPVEFTFEDAKISGIDGLKAYQNLINVKHVDLLIGATSSNGTMAGAPLINSSRTLMISPVTGGSNVDNAGEWIFRLGNSDVLNGKLQAEILKKRGLNKVAVLTEETEYTLDIAKVFEAAFREGGGEISYSNTFQPSTTDFRSQLTLLLRSKPAAIFIPTQTGSALALILNQLSQLGTFDGEIHTTFTAADNPDANALARGKFKGLHYLAPAYAKDHPRLKEFLEFYRSEHKREPLILFHSAAVIDALDILQAFLDKAGHYNSDKFRTHLLTSVKNYSGLLGHFSFDEAGNANTSFVPARIE